jgi:hypothetical protein
MIRSLTIRAPRRLASVLAFGALLGLAGCDSILDVTDPDIIYDAGSAAGALALHNGVILRFNLAMDGGGDAPDGIFLYTGLLADEWRSGDTFEQRNTADQRNIAFTNSFVSDLSRRVHRVRNEAAAAIRGLRQYAPTPLTNIGQMFAFMAYAENQIGEMFCNGIPFSEIQGNTIVYGDPVPYDSAYRRAINHADSALANIVGADSARIRQFAQVIKARALLNRNDPVGAAAAAAAVVTAFQYLSTHSVTANDNALWLQNISLRRYTMADGDGGNGLNFKTANDPRIPPGPTSPATSFDAVTPWNSQGIWLNRTDPVIIASGIEARLIEAEAALRANDAATFIAKLNVARATKAGLAPLTDPGTTTARVDLLFRERAFWMFSTGHRLGDLRRMIRQYGRNAETVFPTGIYFKGGPMGTDVNFPIPQAEQNNPSDPQASCTDRLP